MISRDKRIKLRLITVLLWFVILIGAVWLGYDYSIRNTGFNPGQPVAFSHKKHSGDFGIKCLFCHTTAETSAFSSIPSTKSCMVCHIALKNQSELMKLVNFSFDNNIPIKYNRVYLLPDYSHFNHSRHLRAQIDCSSCHGEVEKSDSLEQVRPLSMGWCLDCHRQPEKFIVRAREISGIIVSDKPYKTDSSLAFVIPPFGMWYDKAYDTSKYFIQPKNPVRGPENCSACHY